MVLGEPLVEWEREGREGESESDSIAEVMSMAVSLPFEDGATGAGCDPESTAGTKLMERVPEKRTTETASATGRTAENGFG